MILHSALIVITGLDPVIHVLPIFAGETKTWMARSSLAMTMREKGTDPELSR
jgi:hypothetical protein